MRVHALGELAAFLCLAGSLAGPSLPAQTVRARDLGIPFDGQPGPLNAITDVAGVEVGHVTLIRGDGPLRVGEGPVRTGVTAVLPRGQASLDEPVFAAWFALNGNGEMTGTTWIDESGFLGGPVMITNTHSVGVVHDAVIGWIVGQIPGYDAWSLPVVAETYDGFLNDINGFHVRAEHAHEALEKARGGAVEEGSVGGGTGMVCYGFKCGIGTASRIVEIGSRSYVLGVLVQSNFGRRHQLRIAGIPVGRVISEGVPYAAGEGPVDAKSSIIAVVATDAPLLPHQLERVVRRVPLGIARTGGTAMNGSGDIFVAFSTADAFAGGGLDPVQVSMLPNETLDPIFAATVEATEEAITNALVTAETMTGRDGHTVLALPHDRLRALLRRHRVLAEEAR